MSVCVHCGTSAPDGTLFCPKCGFTLPQTGVPSPAGAALPASAPPIAWAPASPPTPAPRPTSPPPPSAAAQPAPPPPPMWTPPPTVPISPPPNGKYCVRCGTLIARAAVYCPVCQQPQGP
ncbi:MAG TPA: zinc-ribbon domain-containing protein [Thermoplasmata archaeon]|nr:zinc-ribbon domain-containing protein [Thermoplasmata archaeon]